MTAYSILVNQKHLTMLTVNTFWGWLASMGLNQIKMNNNRQYKSMFKSNSSVALQLQWCSVQGRVIALFLIFLWDLRVYFHLHTLTHTKTHTRTLQPNTTKHTGSRRKWHVTLHLIARNRWLTVLPLHLASLTIEPVFLPHSQKPISAWRQAYIRHAWGSGLILCCHSLLVLGFPICCWLIHLFCAVLSPHLLSR